MTKRVAFFLALSLIAALSVAIAEDWPTFQHDNARSGVTTETLSLPLKEVWTYRAMHAPSPAWPEPAPRDIWHELPQLKPLVIYDRAFHTAIAGDTLYFGSSSDDTVRALDAATGAERWSFVTEAPVRVAPTVAGGKVFVSSDDGRVYCLNASDGRLIWKHAISADARLLPGNGRFISICPVRANVLVDGDTVYCFAGLFPNEGVFGVALNARDGSLLWQQEIADASPQGYPMASPTRLYVPTGRTMPAVFDKATGEYQSTFGGTGGTYALLFDDYIYSRAERTGQVGLSDTTTGERIATFDGLHMLVRGEMAYLHTRTGLSALQRVRHTELARERNAVAANLEEIEKQLEEGPPEGQEEELKRQLAQAKIALKKLERAMDECFTWRKPCDCPYALVLAGDVFFAGGENEVVAFRESDGERLWTGAVQGKAYGLAVADGKLMVSTDEGSIHCFATNGQEHGIVANAALEASPYPDDALAPLYTEAAERIIEATQADKGYGLVLGSGEGRLAYELAKRTNLYLVAVEPDPRKAAVAREALAKAGLYGKRVSVHQRPTTPLPFGAYLFNLVVSDDMLLSGEPPCAASEVFRLLRPYGGVAYLGRPKDGGDGATRTALRKWIEAGPIKDAKVSRRGGVWVDIRRGEVPNSGEWTQLYANSAHTACSGDQLQGPMGVQWFGEPGPRRIIDRHHRPMSSLFKNGRVFVPGDDVVFALDAYNGTPLWELEVPGMRRVGALKNCGHMVLTEKVLYIARQDECWLVDVETGQHTSTLKVPDIGDGQPHDWGYLDQVDRWLFGSGQARGASFNTLHKDMVNTLEGDYRPVIVSRYLFCVDRFSGKERWAYHNGVIMNNDIAIGDGRIYFVESRNATALADDDGRLGIHEFCAGDTFLVALDIKSGKKIYERPASFPFEHIMFVNFAQNTVLVSGTYNRDDKVRYGLFAYHGDTGEPKWDTDYLALDIRGNDPAPTEGSHGEQWQHPVIVGDRIYTRPYDLDLHTGEKGAKWIKRGGHGCGGWTASAGYLYGRGSNPRMYDLSLDETEGDPLTRVSRPGCWLNIIPAGGLVLIPESSSGCTCSYPLQTSLALAPRGVSAP